VETILGRENVIKLRSANALAYCAMLSKMRKISSAKLTQDWRRIWKRRRRRRCRRRGRARGRRPEVMPKSEREFRWM